MRTLDLGIDLDGVCYDFAGSLRRFLHAVRHRPLASMPPPSCWSFYSADWQMTDEEFTDACDEAVDTGHLFWSGAMWPDTDWALHTLADTGHRLHIVTDRSFGRLGVAKQATKCWLERNGLPFDTLTLTADKASVPVDMFVDDRCENYDTLDAVRHRPYLFHRTWNAGHPGRRVATWAEFLAAVEVFSG